MWSEQRTQHGYTLIELLVIIAILGILVSVIVWGIGGKSSRQDCFADGGTSWTAKYGCEYTNRGN